MEASERAIHERVNQVRQEHALDSLEFEDDIAAVAREHNSDVAERGYFAHEAPEGEGPADRLAEFIPGRRRGVGENVANAGLRPRDDPDAVTERVVPGWMDSEGHREHVLRESFDVPGIDVVMTDDERVLVARNVCATDGVV